MSGASASAGRNIKDIIISALEEELRRVETVSTKQYRRSGKKLHHLKRSVHSCIKRLALASRTCLSTKENW